MYIEMNLLVNTQAIDFRTVDCRDLPVPVDTYFNYYRDSEVPGPYFTQIFDESKLHWNSNYYKWKYRNKEENQL